MDSKNQTISIWGKNYTKPPKELISWNLRLKQFETVIDANTEIRPADSSVFRYGGNTYDRRSCRRYTAIQANQVSWQSILIQYEFHKVPRVAGHR